MFSQTKRDYGYMVEILLEKDDNEIENNEQCNNNIWHKTSTVTKKR